MLADADTRSVFAFDATTLERLGETAVSGAPSAIVLAGGGLYVALSDRDEVLELRAHATEKGTLVPGRTLRTSREPVALAAIDKDLLVVTGLGHALERFSLESLAAVKPTVVLAREPRGLLVLPNGDVVVGHASEGPLTFVRAAGPSETADLTEPSVCTSAAADECMTLSDLRATQHFALGLHEGKVLVAGSLSASKGSGSEGGAYGGGGSLDDGFFSNVERRTDRPPPPKKFPVVSLAVDVVSAETRKVETLAGRRRTGSCALPRALVVDAAHKEVVVACLGSEKIARYALGTMRGAHGPEVVVTDPRGTFVVPGGPVALALVPSLVATEDAAIVVYARESRKLEKLTRKGPRLVSTAQVDVPRASEPTPDAAKIAKGRALFHSEDKRISTLGLSCAHCHPDGRDDDVIWTTPAGPRRPLSLVALPGEGPAGGLGWDAKSPTIEHHVKTTIKVHLAGTGLDGPDLEALLTYVRALRPALADSKVDALRESEGGRAFAKAGCATCHEPAHGYGDGKLHDLGKSANMRTPRLAGLGGRRAVFHDGRYTSLDAMFADPALKMGDPSQLSSGERDKLREFLESLD